jgi:hypothetical protein
MPPAPVNVPADHVITETVSGEVALSVPPVTSRATVAGMVSGALMLLMPVPELRSTPEPINVVPAL